VATNTLFGVVELFQEQSLYTAAGGNRVAAMNAHLDRAAEIGTQVVRFPGDWRALQPDNAASYSASYLAEVTAVLQHAQALGIKVIMEFGQSPYWATPGNQPPDSAAALWSPPTGAGADAFASAAAHLATVLKERGVGNVISAWEVWNEPNTTTFWPTATLRPGTHVQADLASADQYVVLLNKTYDALKAADPRITVLGGSLAGNDVEYLARMYELGAKYDGLAVHPYAKANPDNNGIPYSPYETNPNDPLSQVWSFKTGIEAVRAMMVSHGDGAKGLWLTEFGWSSDTGWGSVGSAELQARFIGEALGLVRQWDFVNAALVYQQHDTAAHKFGLRGVDGTVKLSGQVFDDVLDYLSGRTLVPLFQGQKVDVSAAGVASFAAATRGMAVALDVVNGWESAVHLASPQSIRNLTGSKFADSLTGDARANILDGRAGADTMSGGAGDDTYVVDTAADVVIEAAEAGVDTVQTSITLAVLAANVENLKLTGTAAINGTGNALDNVITGNAARNILTGGAGNDTLDGGLGSDVLIGGTGNDVYIVDRTSDVVTENANEGNDTVRSSVTWTLGANIEGLILTGTANINGTGNALDNLLVGTSGNNVLTGGLGDDRLDGGLGVDTLIGGVGNDTYVVDSARDIVTERAGEGIDTLQSTVSITSLIANVENLTLLGTSAINGAGNDVNNIITGNAADNTLNGAAGDDTLSGGGGNDTLTGGTGSDALFGGSGIDTASYSAATASVTVHLLNRTLNTGEAAGDSHDSIENLLGSNFNDTLIADDGNNIVVGGGGNDTLTGLSGDDRLDGGVGDDVLYAGGGVDVLTGGVGNDIMFGDAEADRLEGGAGNDFMVGGTGNDTFVFRAGSGADIILDFTAGVSANDVIELAGLGVSSFAELLARITDLNGSATISFADGSLLSLNGVARAQLAADDFAFL
jgi:Ca2+-binding RTX toxin-like protein